MVCTCGAAPPAGVTSVKMASGFLACLGWAVSTAWCQVLQLASHESRAQTHSIAQPLVAPAYLPCEQSASCTVLRRGLCT